VAVSLEGMSAAPWTVELADEEATLAFGRRLAAHLQAGDCVGLIGTLGSGKTTLCRGLGEGLGCAQGLRSPTYLLCHEAQGRLNLLHLDAYFEERMEGLLLDGLAARFDHQHLILIEWADRLASWWPEDRLSLHLEAREPAGRSLCLTAAGPRSEAVLEALQAEEGVSRA
jgi:tRNA threonylcarbamoyladenosine biosynthesis protein TsaE